MIYLGEEMDQEHVDIMRHNSEMVMPIVLPILVYRAGAASAREWVTGGTGFLVRTEANLFMVTANHVYEEAEAARAESPIFIFTGGNGTGVVDITHWPILGRSADIDVCTIQVPHEFNFRSIGKRPHAPRTWPPRRAEAGESTFILGFPAEHRGGAETAIMNTAMPISDFVTDVGPYKFTIADENNERTSAIIGVEMPEIVNFGGMSGSPILAHRDDGWMEAVGVFIEGGGLVDGRHAPFFGAHTDFINADGTIAHDRIPPRA